MKPKTPLLPPISDNLKKILTGFEKIPAPTRALMKHYDQLFAPWREAEAKARDIIYLLENDHYAFLDLPDIPPFVVLAILSIKGKEDIQNKVGEIVKQSKSDQARQAVNVRHDKPGGSREKQQKIREIWQSGKYSSRDRCAEEECAALGMSFRAARSALTNIPKSPKKT